MLDSAVIQKIIELAFSSALFINALLFIPQAIKIFKDKSAEGVSLLTFFGFLLIQIAIIGHGLIHQDRLLIFGYILSVITCGSVVLLALYYRYPSALKKDKNSTAEVLAQLPGHVYWKDKDGVCLGCNTNNWKDFGLKSLQDFIGKTDYELFTKEEADNLRRADQEVMFTGRALVFEEELTLPDGHKVLYLSHKMPLKNSFGETIGIVGTSVDITLAKKEIEERLATLEYIISVMPGNVYWLSKDGIYLGCNDNQASVIGLKSHKEIVGKRNRDMPGFLIPEVLDKVNEQVITQGKSVTIEEPAVLPDGTQGTFLSNKVPLRNTRGEIIGLLGISIDITERKRHERELQEAKERAEAANKAKTDFLAVVSHELRTPLTGMLGMVDILQHENIAPTQQKEYVDNIQVAAKHLLSLINEILDFAKLDENRFQLYCEAFDLPKTIHKVVDILASKAEEKSVRLKATLAEDLPQVLEGDDKALMQILLNVLGNAIKFTETGGISISVSSIPLEDKRIQLELKIQDTGIGIPADKLDKIFDRFMQVDSSHTRRYGGTGLGLAVTKRLVSLMQGSIYVESKLGKGSVFTIKLPFAVVQSLEEPDMSQANHLPQNTCRKKILLVEDDALIQFIHEHKLQMLGHDVTIAKTGKEALRLSDCMSFDLIFMDIGLPDISGDEVIKAIRQKEAAKNQHTKIVALTAYSDTETNRKSLEAGADSVLCKPVEEKKLRETLL
ncbi:MAG: putative sensory histidine-kinase / response regulator [Gammaproteobacteria bacterium]|jgi:PAS domain S-box-containing protein|nr:putative sensory histidine-kinase / response regulator [Gammaproteobacteria bacterium]